MRLDQDVVKMFGVPTLGPLLTPRLELFVPTDSALLASGKDAGGLASALGRPVAPDWPPQHWDDMVIAWILTKRASDPNEPFWSAWLIALRDGPVVGTCGCKGPPGEDGAVEIGYSVVTSHWRRGIASDAAAALVDWIWRDPRVQLIRAHTLAGDPASSGVLRRIGMALVATMHDPTDGPVDRFEIRRASQK
ncbi:MAG: GNAT family N-acetyltransferase [Phycisphaerales bacterium]|nr:GNAT family N-acetyltransferase [Phycisphaerales bacterium]